MSYEYKVVPAPARGLKAKGVKSAEDRFAYALQAAMNELATDGWEYLRADTLPCEQREGLMSKTTVYQNMLVFRRAKMAVMAAQTPSQPAVTAPRPTTNEAPLVEKKLVAKRSSETPSDEERPAADKASGASPDVAAE